MTRILLLFVINLAVIHAGITANANRKRNVDSPIVFPDELEELGTIKERSRSEMDEYKRIKGMMFKRRLGKQQAENATTTVISSTTVDSEETSSVSLESTTLTNVETSSTLPPVSSSTIVHIVLFTEPDKDEGVEDAPTESNESSLDDRWIISAPTICGEGRKKDSKGNCRKIVP